MKKFYTLLLTTTFLIFSACGGSDTDSQPEAEMPQNLSEGTEMPDDRLYFEMNMDEMASASAGDTLTVRLVAGDRYDLVVIRAEETMPGLLAISANVDGSMEVGQANLIYRNNELRGSVDMYRMGMKYQVYYDADTQQHYLLPRTDDDVLEGSEPLTAPADEVERN
jgi:hypothetical protein